MNCCCVIELFCAWDYGYSSTWCCWGRVKGPGLLHHLHKCAWIIHFNLQRLDKVCSHLWGGHSSIASVWYRHLFFIHMPLGYTQHCFADEFAWSWRCPSATCHKDKQNCWFTGFCKCNRDTKVCSGESTRLGDFWKGALSQSWAITADFQVHDVSSNPLCDMGWLESWVFPFSWCV